MFFSDYFQNSVLITDIIIRKFLSLNKGEWFFNDILIEIERGTRLFFFFLCIKIPLSL